MDRALSKFLFCAVALMILTQCASHLPQSDMIKIDRIKAEQPGLYVEEKSPGTAAILGILPGGGSFYTRQYGYGAVNLLFWPLSVMWDPVNGYGGANDINYVATMANVKKQRKKEQESLDEDLYAKKISQDEFFRKKSALDRKYDFE